MLRRLLRPVVVMLALAAGQAQAQGQVPPQAGGSDRQDRLLEGINLAVVMPPEMAGSPAAAQCGITPDLITDAVIGSIMASGLRTQRYGIAPPFTVETPGVYMVPTLATLREGPDTCISWIELRAQSSQPVTLPATGLFRNAQVLHWDRGLLISSVAAEHAKTVSEAVRRLGAAFGEQWRAEQR